MQGFESIVGTIGNEGGSPGSSKSDCYQQHAV